MSHKILPEYEKLLQTAKANQKENKAFLQKLKKQKINLRLIIRI